MKLVECPRDAMQGLADFIPTDNKVRYINQLLSVGFDTLDFGSFVSPKAIPQMRDTSEVLGRLAMAGTKTKLLAIVANTRGASEAASHDSITYLGFPLSLSETFQLRNTNKSIASALNEVSEIREICSQKNKKLVTYISMGFGNPYGDPYDAAMVAQFVDILTTLGSDIISLSDTIGAATPDDVFNVFAPLQKQYPSLEIGVHLHSKPVDALNKIKSAYDAGCRRFDGALKGFGGCPMAKDELVGNLPTETIIQFLRNLGVDPGINEAAFERSMILAGEIFPKH